MGVMNEFVAVGEILQKLSVEKEEGEQNLQPAGHVHTADDIETATCVTEESSDPVRCSEFPQFSSYVHTLLDGHTDGHCEYHSAPLRFTSSSADLHSIPLDLAH